MRGYGSLYDGGRALLLMELVASGESADGDDESVSIANRRQCAPGAARLRPQASRRTRSSLADLVLGAAGWSAGFVSCSELRASWSCHGTWVVLARRYLSTSCPG
jgi:hypothetical protein